MLNIFQKLQIETVVEKLIVERVKDELLDRSARQCTDNTVASRIEYSHQYIHLYESYFQFLLFSSIIIVC